MGKPDQASRLKVLLWLAGFVVVFGGVSWLVSGGINRGTPSLVHSHLSTGSPEPTPGRTPPFCGSGQLELDGAFDDCASIDRSSADNCAVTPHTIYAVFKLLGTRHEFLLSLNIPVRYPEPGDYYLTGGSEVDVTNDATGAFWRSVAGVLSTTTADGRSGIVNANLTYDAGGSTPPPVLSLRIQGPWRC
jgi:hypothetical protein